MNCPICDMSSIKSVGHPKDPHNKIINCKKCGNYLIFDTVLTKMKFPETLETHKEKISSWITEQNIIFKNPLPELTQDTFDSILQQRDKTIKEKFDCFMKTLLSIADNEGKISIDNLSHNNYCYIQKKDFEILINKAKKNHYIDDVSYNDYTYQLISCKITYDGIEYIESLQQTNTNSKNIFCAFHFTKELQNIFDNKIKSTIEPLGYSYSRVSSSTTATDKKIDDQIISLIRSARIVIADFTGQRQSVYFEAGFAMGLNIPVIWTCREDVVNELSFDTRQYPHIIWKNKEDLARQIENRIKALP